MLDMSRYLHEDLDLKQDDPAMQTKVRRILEIQKQTVGVPMQPAQKTEVSKLISEVQDKYMEHMKTFPDRAQMKLSNYADRR